MISFKKNLVFRLVDGQVVEGRAGAGSELDIFLFFIFAFIFFMFLNF
jgi:hypothetical protein